MRFAALLLLCASFPLLALAGDPPLRTCDQCQNVEEWIYPTPAWQTVSGSTVGEINSEYAYYFCAVGGGTYRFTTCDEPGLPGGADYDPLRHWGTGAGPARK